MSTHATYTSVRSGKYSTLSSLFKCMSNKFRKSQTQKSNTVKGEKAEKIQHLILLNPEYTAKEVAELAKADVSWVYQVGEKMNHIWMPDTSRVVAEFAGDEASDWEIRVCEQEFAFLTQVQQSLLEGMIHPDEVKDYIEDAFDVCFDYPQAADEVGLYQLAETVKKQARL